MATVSATAESAVSGCCSRCDKSSQRGLCGWGDPGTLLVVGIRVARFAVGFALLRTRFLSSVEVVVQFEVGDEVRTLTGRVGVVGIVSIDSLYRVEFGGMSHAWYRAENLAPVSEPRVYKLQVPEEPAGVDRVRPVGHEWMRYERMDTGDWVREDSSSLVYDWQELLKMHPEGVEPVPSDFEVSLDYLRRNAHLLDGLAASGVTGSHAAAVVRGVLEKEGSE